MSKVICPYCERAAVFVEDSSLVYRKDYGPIWYCKPCQAWVGCHDGTRKPLAITYLTHQGANHE
jgi:hypothetical protein